jgi:uncharacterized protein
MKLKADRIEGLNSIARHGTEGVIVNAIAYRRSVIVPWRGAVLDWAVTRFDALEERHFAQIADLDPELVIFGSGARLRFARPALMRALIERNIGFETMDTAAACRTYNVLLAEDRAVIAALLFEPG